VSTTMISSDKQRRRSSPATAASKPLSLLKIERVTTLRLSHLSDAERRAYVLADNKRAQNAGLAVPPAGDLALSDSCALAGSSLSLIARITHAAIDFQIGFVQTPGRAGLGSRLPALSRRSPIWGCALSWPILAQETSSRARRIVPLVAPLAVNQQTHLVSPFAVCGPCRRQCGG
jgi:hypothetical protein